MEIWLHAALNNISLCPYAIAFKRWYIRQYVVTGVLHSLILYNDSPILNLETCIQHA